MATIEIYQDDSDKKEWRWTVTADDTVTGKSSEGFHSKSYALSNLKSLPLASFQAAGVGISKVAAKAWQEALTLDQATAALAKFPELGAEGLSFYRDDSDDSNWRWRVKAGNGLITHASVKGWATKQEAVANVAGLHLAVKDWNDAG